VNGDFSNRRKLEFATREKRILLVAFSRRMVDVSPGPLSIFFASVDCRILRTAILQVLILLELPLQGLGVPRLEALGASPYFSQVFIPGQISDGGV
jgi:hypothetical protein